MSEAENRRVVSLPLEEHAPLTVAEAGLVLDTPPRGRGRLVVLIVGVLVAGVAFVLLTRGGSATTVVDLSPGACFEPVVSDVSEVVDAAACAPGTARVVQKVPGTVDPEAPYPGGGALRVDGAGACQAEVDADRLVVAVPSPAAWADGDRTLVCTERQ